VARSGGPRSRAFLAAVSHTGGEAQDSQQRRKEEGEAESHPIKSSFCSPKPSRKRHTRPASRRTRGSTPRAETPGAFARGEGCASAAATGPSCLPSGCSRRVQARIPPRPRLRRAAAAEGEREPHAAVSCASRPSRKKGRNLPGARRRSDGARLKSMKRSSPSFMSSAPRKEAACLCASKLHSAGSSRSSAVGSHTTSRNPCRPLRRDMRIISLLKSPRFPTAVYRRHVRQAPGCVQERR